MQGFDLPLATMTNETFNQPIFGANNLSGMSPPLGSELTDAIKWTIYFKEGGVGTFLPVFFRLVTEMRHRMQQPESGGHNSFNYEGSASIPQAVCQQIVGAAYVDPNDPTKLYVSQPSAATQGVPVP